MIGWKYVKMKAFKNISRGEKYKEVGAHFLDEKLGQISLIVQAMDDPRKVVPTVP